MALTSLSSLVYSSFSAFVLPFTDWKKRLEGEIRPFFPGIKPVDIEEKRREAFLQKLGRGSYVIFSQDGWAIHEKYLKDHQTEAKERSYVIRITELTASAVGGLAAYQLQHHLWKIGNSDNSHAGLLIKMMVSFTSAISCLKVTQSHIQKGLAICLEKKEKFKVWREVHLDVNAEKIITTYNEDDYVLSAFQCPVSSERIVHATYDEETIMELDLLKEAAGKRRHANLHPSQVQECYATTMVIHKRVIFLYEKAVASFRISDATKEEGKFKEQITNAKKIAEEACKMGVKEDKEWIEFLRFECKISMKESSEETKLIEEIYEKTDFSKEESWNNKEWKAVLASRFRRLFYEYFKRAPDLSLRNRKIQAFLPNA